MRLPLPMLFQCCFLLCLCRIGIVNIRAAEGPCSSGGPPAGTVAVEARAISAPPEVLNEVQPLPPGYQVNSSYSISTPGVSLYLVEYDNFNTALKTGQPMVDINQVVDWKVVVIEKDRAGIRHFLVNRPFSAKPVLMQNVSAYRRGGAMYIQTSFNSQGNCTNGLIHKVQNQYLHVTSREFGDSSPIDYPAAEREFVSPALTITVNPADATIKCSTTPTFTPSKTEIRRNLGVGNDVAAKITKLGPGSRWINPGVAPIILTRGAFGMNVLEGEVYKVEDSAGACLVIVRIGQTDTDIGIRVQGK